MEQVVSSENKSWGYPWGYFFKTDNLLLMDSNGSWCGYIPISSTIYIIQHSLVSSQIVR